ncbi:glyoxylase-like metal-dependent hydrolase (beta-lactamase superfamily II) [Deinococcus yavapaiensis KR-236]|uniref:Glyoxylase-like metal-dependent hydrolase (Beta-lactamase superfamily II) n=2 Tax=Deinococcus TaxID=1298 RepID=A0A318SRM4_9DEIO|nr:glyoxylase-like metal-dependent hydrolase (beta-lactamase superfamily II) [Deinococcus yavapaiensis KR-236]
MPSANVVLVRGEANVLIDTGFGSDVDELEGWLMSQGVPPSRLDLVVNTHHHSDHVGANAHLQHAYDVRIAAHRWEADLVNRRAPEAWSARWLDQPVEPYDVNVRLEGGEDVHGLRVVHTPGHSLGHVSLHDPAERVLILGDTVHHRDVAWINPFLEGAGGVDRMIGSVERLASLSAVVAFTGHGPPLTNLDDAFRAALGKLESWIRDPERMWWHGAKRTFAYALMLRGGLSEGELQAYLLARAWVRDYAESAFRVTREEFAALLVAEMLRSGAARWHDGRLRATTPCKTPPPAWLEAVFARA